jgi:steroid delta-isomerase-like uncharacterized protein
MKKLIYLIAAVFLFSCGERKEMATNDSKGTANEKRMQEFYDKVMNAHNPELVDSFCTPDMVDHQAPPNQASGLDGLKASFREFFAAYPDIHFKTNWMKSSGDTVIAHFTMTGTNSGPFMGMPATNKQFNIDGVDIVTIKDGKANEHWGYQEEMKMMSQIGVMGGPADSSAMSAEKK